MRLDELSAVLEVLEVLSVLEVLPVLVVLSILEVSEPEELPDETSAELAAVDVEATVDVVDSVGADKVDEVAVVVAAAETVVLESGTD